MLLLILCNTSKPKEVNACNSFCIQSVFVNKSKKNVGLDFIGDLFTQLPGGSRREGNMCGSDQYSCCALKTDPGMEG